MEGSGRGLGLGGSGGSSCCIPTAESESFRPEIIAP